MHRPLTICILLLLLLGLLEVRAYTNIQAIQLFTGGTNNGLLSDSVLAAGANGPGTWDMDSGFGFTNRYWRVGTNWPYRLPGWVQLGGTNYQQVATNWVYYDLGSNAPLNDWEQFRFTLPGVGGGIQSNLCVEHYFLLDGATSANAFEPNIDIMILAGQFGNVTYIQLALRTNNNSVIYAHGGATNGWQLPIKTNIVYLVQAQMNSLGGYTKLQIFNATNNYQAVTNIEAGSGFPDSSVTPTGAATNAYTIRFQANYLNTAKGSGRLWMSSPIFYWGSNTVPRVPETNVIASDHTFQFVKGSTVGVRGGIPARTGGTTIDVTQAPYGVDKGGVTNATTGINSALAAASSNDVVYLPAGVYNCASNQVNFDTSGVELRGELTNGIPASTIVGSLNVGHSTSGNQLISLTNGGWKGSTNLVLSATNTSDGNLGIGDLLLVSDRFDPTNTEFMVRAVGVGGSYHLLADQMVTVIGFNGYTVNISAPLIYWFTNTTARAKTKNTPGLRARPKMGIRDLRITGLMPSYGLSNSAGSRVSFTTTVDNYITNSIIDYPHNYALTISSSTHFEIERVLMQHADSVGTSRSGMTMDSVANGLVNNCVFNDLTIGWQVQGGSFGAMAFGYNYYTNISDKAFTVHGAHPWFTLHEGEKSIAGNVVLGDGYFGSSSSHYLYLCYLEYTVASKRWAHHNQFVRNFLGLRNVGTQVYLAPRTSNYSEDAIFEDDFPHLGNKGFNGTVPNISPFWPGTYTSVSGTITNHPYDIVLTITTNVLGTNLFDTTDARQRWTTNYQAALAIGAGNFPIIFQDASNTNRYWLDDTVVQFTTAGPTNITLDQTITVSNGWKMFMGGAGGYNMLQTNTWTHIRHANDVYTNGVGVSTRVYDPLTLPLSFPDSLVYSSKPGWFGTNVYPADGSSPIPAETWFSAVNGDAPVIHNVPARGGFRGFRGFRK